VERGINAKGDDGRIGNGKGRQMREV
jgi:hypothetical protein